MLDLQRDSSTSIREQLVQQLRYHIASGTFALHSTLPSTRDLAKQAEVSFHTVRKAYQDLQDEGLLKSKRGSGYVVVSRGGLSKSERMERGASIVQDTVRQLIGLGMSEREMEYLYQEQLALLELDQRDHKLLFISPCRELARKAARLLASELQEEVRGIHPDEASKHADADIVFTTFPLIQQSQTAIPRADMVGITPQLQGRALDRIARLLDHETLGLIVRHHDSIPFITRWIKQETGFQGQLLAGSIDDGRDAIRQYSKTADYLVCLSDIKAAVVRHLTDEIGWGAIEFSIPSSYLEVARGSIPGR